MLLRKLTIQNFRGIKKLEWVVSSPFVALLGPGDSTKTTILDAVGLVLSSRYNATFTDADFYDCDTSSEIRIEAVISDLPDSLVNERSHGMNRSGIDADGRIHHDPNDDPGVDECLIIRLRVDQTLEPVWEVVRPDEDDGDRITASQRAELGFFRIGDQVDSHLRWGRGSALTSLTASKTDAAYAVVEAQRQARDAIDGLEGTPLHAAAEIAHAEVKKLGSGPFKKLRPGLDPRVSSGTSALVLHDEKVPLTQFGLGSRRLLSLSIQEKALVGNSIVAIDEIESGLDPHRLAHLIRYLRKRASQGELQVLFTTHSPLVVESLSHHQAYAVRSASGKTRVHSVPAELTADDQDILQGVMRERPSALLARRVVVGEGATEVGFLRYLFGRWNAKRTSLEDATTVTNGVGLVNGGGDIQAPKRAAALAALGYPTLLLVDGDVATNKDAIEEARSKGAVIVQWSAGNALEDIVIDALTVAGLQSVVDYAVEDRDEEAVRNAVQARLKGTTLVGISLSDWIGQSSEDLIRRAIALTAKGAKQNGNKEESKAWFKREDRGEDLANLLFGHSDKKRESEVKAALKSIKPFVFPDTE